MRDDQLTGASGGVFESADRAITAFAPEVSRAPRGDRPSQPAETIGKRTKAILLGNTGPAGETLLSVYGLDRIEYLKQVADVHPELLTTPRFEQLLPELADTEVIFGTWGMPALSEAHLDQLPKLRAVFYAGGSVHFFAGPMVRRGIVIVSGAAANAVPVAEFTVGQMLLANKGYFCNVREYRALGQNYLGAFRGRGNYGATIAILGAGQIGRRVVHLLRPYRLRIVVFDPFLSAEEIREMGAHKVTLAEAFEEGDIVSNHVADVPATSGMLTGELFESMRPHATFINTGRGGTVDHDGLVRVLRERPDLTALLDVTTPEPLQPDSPLWSLPNVIVSGHIAGAIGNERTRLADLVIEEFERWQGGKSLRYSVDPDALWRMA